MFDIYRQTGSVTKALRRYRLQFPGRRAPSTKMFYRLKKKFFETGSLNRKKTVRPKTVLTEETEINILAYLRANPQNSLNHVVGELPVSIGSAHAVTKKYKFHPYKVKRVQKLTPAQKELRLPHFLIKYCGPMSRRFQLAEVAIAKIDIIGLMQILTKYRKFSFKVGSP